MTTHAEVPAVTESPTVYHVGLSNGFVELVLAVDEQWVLDISPDVRTKFEMLKVLFNAQLLVTVSVHIYDGDVYSEGEFDLHLDKETYLELHERFGE